MKWAVPLLTEEGKGREFLEHGTCTQVPCLLCEAMENLEPEDWSVVAFYRHVRDQVVNLLPMHSEPLMVPRMEAWVAVLDLHGVPQEHRAHLVTATRTVHDGVEGRIPLSEILRMPAYRTKPPEVPHG